MRPFEIARILKRSPATIRAWSLEYADFLLPNASGGDGRHRDYSERDLSILAVIANMKQSGRSSDEITVHLQQLQRDDWRGLPQPPVLASLDSVPIASSANTLANGSDVRALLQEMAFLQSQIQRLEKASADERERLYREIGELRQKLGTAQERIRNLGGDPNL